MHEQTYLEYFLAVAQYLENEWPAVAFAVENTGPANSAAARACLGCFLACATVPHAAGEVANAVAAVVNVS